MAFLELGLTALFAFANGANDPPRHDRRHLPGRGRGLGIRRSPEGGSRHRVAWLATLPLAAIAALAARWTLG